MGGWWRWGGADTTPPNITSFSPSNNATFIDQAATVSVTFNELINKSSITAESFVLRDQSNRQVSGEMEITKLNHILGFDFFDYTKIRFVPDTRLQDSTQYHVLVGTGMKDKAGNHLSNEVTWTFTTAPGGSGTWAATSLTNAPNGREGHTAVWTGTEMIIWGGSDLFNAKKLNDGARYNPMTDTWSDISTQGAPSPRLRHTAIWTGTEMIIWGGMGLNGNGEYIELDDGARYNPATDTWQSISPQGAPSARVGHSAVWTGNEMLIWGGYSGIYPAGARYNPASDTWQSMSTVNEPTRRSGHGAVWTGTEMIVWGGSNDSSGGRYDPNADSWVPTSTLNAPSGRAGQSIVWTGNEMIVWGGYDGFQKFLDSGGKYNPVSDSWVMTSQSNTPLARGDHNAVWTGAEMIVWGGQSINPDSRYPRIGGLYDPVNDVWFYTTTLDSPAGDDSYTAIWTGNQMVVWGGLVYSGLNAVPHDGGLYTP